VQIVEHADDELPVSLRAAVRVMVDEAWPDPIHETDAGQDDRRLLHDPALRPWWMLLVEDGVAVASLAILRKPILHADRPYLAGGLSAVVTRASHRGEGRGHRLVVAARERMAGQGFDLGIFTCDRTLQRFYEGAGWRQLPGTVVEGGTVDEPFPSDRPGFDKVTMADFFSAAARARQDDFVGTRVALHPGTIDKLW
jgi:aminoglycoside 2'-N-acetyltransferase I